MKKIIFFTIILGFVSTTSYSQMGVGTSEPKGALHVDAKKDTQSTGSNSSDDFIVTGNGNVGVGILTPTQKLEVVGDMVTNGKEQVAGNVTTDLFVADDKLTVGGQATSASFSSLDILSSTVKGGLRIDDGSQKINITPTISMLPVLTAADNGQVFWTNLQRRGESAYQEGRLIIGVPLNNGKGDIDTDITSTPMVLTEGTWLIMGEMGAQLSNTVDKTGGFALYLKLYRDNNSFPLAVSAATSETIGLGVATPQFSYVVKVPASKSTFRLKMSTSITKPYLTTNEFGEPYFFAVKLD